MDCYVLFKEYSRGHAWNIWVEYFATIFVEIFLISLTGNSAKN